MKSRACFIVCVSDFVLAFFFGSSFLYRPLQFHGFELLPSNKLPSKNEDKIKESFPEVSDDLLLQTST